MRTGRRGSPAWKEQPVHLGGGRRGFQEEDPSLLRDAESRPPVFALLGVAPGSGNRGVQALGTSLVQLLQELAGPAEIVLLANHDRHEEVGFPCANGLQRVRVVPARLSPWALGRDHLAVIVLAALLYRVLPLGFLRRGIRGRLPWIDVLAQARLVADIRGGDSFSDLYGMQRFCIGFLMAWAAVLVRGGLVQLPQTFGPYRSRLSRLLAGYLLRNSTVILARDVASAATASQLVKGRRPVRLCPDVAFALPARAPQALELDGQLVPWEVVGRRPSGHESFVAPVGVNVNGLMYEGGYNRRNMFGLRLDYRELLPRLLQVLLEEHQGEVWLIPHTYGPAESVESDPEACRRVWESLPFSLRERVRRVTGEYQCDELKAIIGLCDFFIGSRMHSCIAALSQGIPTVGIAYSDKFQGVFETVGVGDWVVDGRKVGEGEAIQQVVAVFRRRAQRRQDLAQNAEAARRRLLERFAEVLDLSRPGQRLRSNGAPVKQALVRGGSEGASG